MDRVCCVVLCCAVLYHHHWWWWLLLWCQSLGLPVNVKKLIHVNKDFEWSGQNLEELFDLVDLLGEGAFGSVYRAVHKKAGMELAIKLIPATNAAAMADIKKEIDILKKCRHSSIVCFYGVWGPDTKNRLYNHHTRSLNCGVDCCVSSYFPL